MSARVTLQRLERAVRVIVVFLTVTVLLGNGGLPPQALESKIERLTWEWTFDFLSWELRTLSRKVLYSLLAPQRFMSDLQQSRFVLDYLDRIAEARRLDREIERIFSDPEISDPVGASEREQQELSLLRQEMRVRAPVAEAVLQAQVSVIFIREGGFGPVILPPVSGSFTPLPHILIISPRAIIETIYQQQLTAGLSAAQQSMIEERIMQADPEVSAYVTAIGGLAAYPAMLLESSSIDWVADTMAHEWVHHHLAFAPLGWAYMESAEARTINETTASLIGDWGGQEVVLHFYRPLLSRAKGLPDPLRVSEEPTEREVVFDFRAEMHHTRVVVDRLLAEGRVKEAEWYMELQRRYFVANGYRIRRLNQAYFAFHGAYASEPGAAGEDPVGPLVRRLWALSESPAAFLRAVAPATSLEKLQTLMTRQVG